MKKGWKPLKVRRWRDLELKRNFVANLVSGAALDVELVSSEE